MSSYFDTMAGCVGNDGKLLKLVIRQFGWYLRQVNEECWQSDLERLGPFESSFGLIEEQVITKEGDPSLDPAMFIQRIHTIAHDLARARIRLRGSRYAGDNPPIPY